MVRIAISQEFFEQHIELCLDIVEKTQEPIGITTETHPNQLGPYIVILAPLNEAIDVNEADDLQVRNT